MSVRIHIEELVLHGFAPADREAVAEAIRLELERGLGGGLDGAFTDGGPAGGAPGGAIDRLDAGSVTASGAQPRVVGTAVGGALAGALGGRR